MNLLETKINQEYIIEKINIDKCTNARLQALGVLKGTKIKVLNKISNGAIMIKIRGTRLGINKEVAEAISCIYFENEEEEESEEIKYSFYR